MSSPITENPTTPIKRRLRVSTGCKTCRTRRIKCDEGKPTCKNCGKKNRACSYGSRTAGRERNHASSSRNNVHQRGEAFVAPEDAVTPVSQDRSSNGSTTVVHSDIPGHIEGIHTLPRTPPASLYTPEGTHNAPHQSIHTNLGAILQNDQLFSPAFDWRDDPLEALKECNTSKPNWTSSTHSPNRLVLSYQIPLSVEEISIFRNYVEKLSRWIDSFSQDQPFYSVVPVIALRCPVLMHSCLALSAKQLALTASSDKARAQENVAVFYHQKAIKAVSELLEDSNCMDNEGLLASSIILSTYEMLDVAGDSFGSHLKGVSYLLQARQVNGDSRGIKGAAYWTWYRHEIWAALQTGRPISLDETYWKPKEVDSLEESSAEEISNRVIFIFGQCVSFFNEEPVTEGMSLGEIWEYRHGRATALDDALEDWKQKLPTSTACLFSEHITSSDTATANEHPFLWFLYPQAAIAHQVYHASKILLHLKCPIMPPDASNSPLNQTLSNSRQIARSRDQIFLVSNAGVSDTWSLISTQCLYIAGMVTDGVLEQRRAIELIESCQKSSGRRTVCLAASLRKLWDQNREI